MAKKFNRKVPTWVGFTVIGIAVLFFFCALWNAHITADKAEADLNAALNSSAK